MIKLMRDWHCFDYKVNRSLYKSIRSFGVNALKISPNVKQSKRSEDNDVVVEEIYNKGILMLNRREQMNSVTRLMLKNIYSTFMHWEHTKDLVILRPYGNQNLGTGGDLKSYYVAMKTKDENYKRTFMCLLYALCHMMGTYKTPYLSIMNGPTMGAGLGMSIHAKYKIVTEKSVVAMPEPRVGMFTDVSSTYFLPRLEGKLGTFLALTGYRLKGTDILHSGIATHYVPSEQLESVYMKLIELEEPEIEQFLNENYKYVNNDFSLATYIPLINHSFSHENIMDIIKSLNEDGSTFARKLIDQIRLMSPTSLKVTHSALKKGSQLTLEECMQMEFRLVVNGSTENCDFVEGIRAVLIDKDQKPKWNPARLEDVDDDVIEQLFSPIPGGYVLPIHDRELLFM